MQVWLINLRDPVRRGAGSEPGWGKGWRGGKPPWVRMELPDSSHRVHSQKAPSIMEGGWRVGGCGGWWTSKSGLQSQRCLPKPWSCVSVCRKGFWDPTLVAWFGECHPKTMHPVQGAVLGTELCSAQSLPVKAVCWRINNFDFSYYDPNHFAEGQLSSKVCSFQKWYYNPRDVRRSQRSGSVSLGVSETP